MCTTPPEAELKPLGEEEASSQLTNKSSTSGYQWWIQMLLYSLFVLSGQGVGTILGRLYFDNGGRSQWIATLMQVVGFPILIPFRWLKSPAARHDHLPPTEQRQKKFPLILVPIYIAIGIFTAGDCLLYTIGMRYLPITTYILLCATQLGFNAFFSYFLNAQKFTPYIVNSLLLLTLSSVILVFNHDDQVSNAPSSHKHAIGFICTVAGSAGYAFMLSITQLTFTRIIKKETAAAIIDMAVYQSLVASIVVAVGVFASGDWRKLHTDMMEYNHGPTSYVMNLFWTAVSWQLFMVGCVGLIFRVSALFSNVISILGTPLAPVISVVLLHEKMTGLKGISMVLAMWGFVSYMYQHYLDDLEKKKAAMTTMMTNKEQVAEIGLTAADPVH